MLNFFNYPDNDSPLWNFIIIIIINIITNTLFEIGKILHSFSKKFTV